MVDNTYPYIGSDAFHHRARHGLAHWSSHNARYNGTFMRSCIISTVGLKRLDIPPN